MCDAVGPKTVYPYTLSVSVESVFVSSSSFHHVFLVVVVDITYKLQRSMYYLFLKGMQPTCTAWVVYYWWQRTDGSPSQAQTVAKVNCKLHSHQQYTADSALVTHVDYVSMHIAVYLVFTRLTRMRLHNPNQRKRVDCHIVLVPELNAD